jgi:hypothetical protein
METELGLNELPYCPTTTLTAATTVLLLMSTTTLTKLNLDNDL